MGSSFGGFELTTRLLWVLVLKTKKKEDARVSERSSGALLSALQKLGDTSHTVSALPFDRDTLGKFV